jgi:signal transduction histidine kinase
LIVAIVVAVVVATRVAVGGLLARANRSVHQGRVVRARQGQARLSRALVEAVDSAKEQERARARLTHDARNACAGVRASLELLDHHQAELSAETKARLRQIALSGLAHLEEVIVQTDLEARAFSVTEVVDAVVASRSACGASVAVLGGDVWARGRPNDLARALINLLVNAERHAPGTSVVVEIARRGEVARVCVTDGGPGIAAADADAVFERGWRSPDSGGQGLGLHTARGLLRSQGGDLCLVPSSHGAAFALTLPAAPAASRPAPGPRDQQSAARPPDVMAAR